MKCMYCKDDALPQKALCSVCLQDTERRRAQTSILPSQRKEYEREMYPPAEPASHIARLLAFCLDLLVLGIISQLILFFAFQLMEIDYRFLKDVLQPSGGVWSVEALDKLRIISFVSVASLAVPAILYNVIFEASFLGATPGKLSLGLIVESNSGEPLAFDQAVRRFAIKGCAAVFPLLLVIASAATGCSAARMLLLLALFGVLVSFVTLIDPFFIFLTPGRRALHDLIGGSCVVQRVKAGWLSYLFSVFALIFLAVMLIMTVALWGSAY
jgi:uncharacterized RDD family membrane protein YckC